MATTNLPRVSSPTQQVSEQQLVFLVLIDLFDSFDRLMGAMDHYIAQIDDLVAISRGQMIEGEVVRRDY